MQAAMDHFCGRAGSGIFGFINRLPKLPVCIGMKHHRAVQIGRFTNAANSFSRYQPLLCRHHRGNDSPSFFPIMMFGLRICGAGDMRGTEGRRRWLAGCFLLLLPFLTGVAPDRWNSCSVPCRCSLLHCFVVSACLWQRCWVSMPASFSAGLSTSR